MTVVETLLVFAAAPLAVVLLLAALTLRPDRTRSRYRPGQPWEHEAVWYEPHAEHGPAAGHGGGHSGGHGGARPALEAGATGRPARSGGPLGGARGTW
ncbi:hypothetical protein OF117_16340 [Geodermatophilus sp. YIM 151500]|uniref:aa3-type cytochrome oxidase subunit CtaJ n=1 Tax=Geodermatophilus sp. YIM 151500 TaxID=2984531 RepID=UPI0021E3E7EF|nr:hypothetical protein [Geodermatophilus sp. YIM 151500]MCV2490925.1 hypothetical protein [Geodermatophilus sp. YIM 151500]